MDAPWVPRICTRRPGCRGSARLQGSGRVGSSGWHCQQPETNAGTERPQEHGAGTLQPFLLWQGGWWALTGDPGGVGLPGKSLTAGCPWKERGIIREASSVGEAGSRAPAQSAPPRKPGPQQEQGQWAPDSPPASAAFWPLVLNSHSKGLERSSLSLSGKPLVKGQSRKRQ